MASFILFDSARFSIADLTLSSAPVWVWITYHFLAIFTYNPCLNTKWIIFENEKSKTPKITVNTNTEIMTIHAELTSSALLDHETFFISLLTSFKNVFMFSIAFIAFFFWQDWRDSNPQRTDLESAALPIRATGLCLFYFFMSGVLSTEFAELL